MYLVSLLQWRTKLERLLQLLLCVFIIVSISLLCKHFNKLNSNFIGTIVNKLKI